MINFKELASEYKTPLYIYDLDYMSSQFHELKAAFKGRKSIMAYAVKANSNLSVVKHFADLGSGADCVSIGEVRRAFLAGIPSYKIIFVPFFYVLTFIFASGVCLFFSALVVKYHDFKAIVPFLLQLGIYITPVGFSSSIVPEYLKFWYSFNPLVGIVDGFRWAIIGRDVPLYLPGLIVAIVITFLTFLIGLVVFRKMEKTFADVI